MSLLSLLIHSLPRLFYLINTASTLAAPTSAHPIHLWNAVFHLYMDFSNFSKINSKLTVFAGLKCKPQNCNGRSQWIDRLGDIPRSPHYSPIPQVQEAVTQGATRKLSSSWLGLMINHVETWASQACSGISDEKDHS